jgi:ferrous iron transport protein A
MELGIVPGTEIEVVRRAPLGDPIELRLRRVHLALRREEAAFIHVAAV